MFYSGCCHVDMTSNCKAKTYCNLTSIDIDLLHSLLPNLDRSLKMQISNIRKWLHTNLCLVCVYVCICMSAHLFIQLHIYIHGYIQYLPVCVWLCVCVCVWFLSLYLLPSCHIRLPDCERVYEGNIRYFLVFPF